MEKYIVFSSNQTGMSNSLPPQEIFRLWVAGLKDSTHRWWVEQVVIEHYQHPCHIQLDLDCTKLWCGVESAPEPKELHYQPTMEEIFTELERQINQELEIPPEAQQTGVPLVLPLTDGEQEEEREATLYTIPFVEGFTSLDSCTCKSIPR
jgi:hypothetical protein